MVLWHQAESRVLKSLFPLFSRNQTKSKSKGAVRREGKDLETPRALLGPSQGLLSARAVGAVLINTNVTVRGLNATKYTEKREESAWHGYAEPDHCHKDRLKCPHKEDKKKSTFCNRINSFFLFFLLRPRKVT